MKIFKNMSLEEAKDLYKKLKQEKERLEQQNLDVFIVKTSMENIEFFTDNFQHDY